MSGRAARAIALALAVLCISAWPAGASGGHGDGVGFRLQAADVTPSHPLFDGKRKIRLHYRFAAKRTVDLRLEVVRLRSGNVVRSWTERRAAPGRGLDRAWDGLTRRGKAAPDGRYEFRIGPAGKAPHRAAGLKLRGHVFPVDGPHGTRGAIGEFGAPRNGGRVHEGFDITGDCGTPLLAARGGIVAKTGYDPVLYGYYVLIDGAKTPQDTFYAHLIAPSPLHDGGRVRTAEELGRIGQTGDAAGTPCHLHFEIRVHGKPIDPEPPLRRWDRYS